MIKDHSTAEALLKEALSVNATLNESIRTLMAVGTEQEIKAYKVAVGHVMFEVFQRIVKPILAEHPGLTPPEMRQ